MADPTVPARKPFRREGKTTHTHHRDPVEKSTAGKMYRVRDKDEGGSFNVWGENLSYADAVKLKESVAARRLSKTVRVEEMNATPYVGVFQGIGNATNNGGGTPRKLVGTAADRSSDSYLAEIQKKAARAAAPIAALAQQRHEGLVMKDNVMNPVPDGGIELPDPEEIDATGADVSVDDLLDDSEDDPL